MNALRITSPRDPESTPPLWYIELRRKTGAYSWRSHPRFPCIKEMAIENIVRKAFAGPPTNTQAAWSPFFYAL